MNNEALFLFQNRNEWEMVQEYYNWRAQTNQKEISWLRKFVTSQRMVN